MGSGPSQEDYDRSALQVYGFSLQHTCLLPDIGIDESLLAYSGTDSNAVLQSFSCGLVSDVPGYIDRFGASLGSLTPIPNAVGLGALVISMIIELVLKSASPAQDESYSLLRRVFGEEKASGVRDTMSEYLKRHQMFIYNDQQLREEIQRLEQQLSNHLTILRNSLLHDGQMSTRGLKIWVNGASFHLQMLIHEARLNIQAGRPSSNYVNAIRAANNLYVQDLDRLLENYKTHEGSINFHSEVSCGKECTTFYYIQSDKCRIYYGSSPEKKLYRGPQLAKAFMNHVVTKYEPITRLRGDFLNILYNLDALINQRGSFSLK